MNITVIKEGNFKVDADKNFIPLNKDEVYKGIKLAIQPFLITTVNDVILLDTGLDVLENNEPIILKKLAENNINPNSITKVLVSHLHKDHAGGLGYFKDNVFIQNFPNASIYIQQREFNNALQQTTKSYATELLHALKNLSNIIWLNDDEGEITNEITYKVTAAHAMFHQVFWIKSDHKIVFYGADDLPTNGHLTRHIAFKTDYNGHKAMELRKTWGLEAKKNNWQILLYHDIKTPLVQF